jgi:2-polyprenyl-3-methyl-5-hydroxy-6-metoxy-1,4-benzoquinol methylase
MTEKNQYSIAVLLPTRGRTRALGHSVKSLINRCTIPESVQLLLGFDTDDKIGRKYFEEELQPWLDEKEIAYTAMEFEPMGYHRLNEYVSALGQASSADWLFFWNDDAVMETTGWDKIIENYTGQFKILAVHTHRDHPYSIFPIVPRAWMEQLGYLSPHPLTDAWISQIAYKLDIWERIEVYVTHDRHDLTGNNKDATFDARDMKKLEGNPQNPKDFHNPAWIGLRMKETEILSMYMEQQGLDITWWKNIKLGKQEPWEKLKLNDVNNQMAHFKITLKDKQMSVDEDKNKSTQQENQIYDYNYFKKADGHRSWKSGNLKFGDSLAALGYAHGISWQQLVAEFPAVFKVNEHGRGEATTKILQDQISFLNRCAVRKPKKVLEIGGGRGEVANVLKYMGIEVVSVELGKDAERWYHETGKHYFGSEFEPAKPVVQSIGDVIDELNLEDFDTVLMIESLEHIPEKQFDPVWQTLKQKFHGLFIVVNWPDYHPIWIGRDATPEEHCRQVDDKLYDLWTSEAKTCVYRNGSHLVLEL